MRSRSRTVLLTFVGAHVVNDFYVTVLPAFLPALADEFGLDYTELGVLSLSFSILSGVLQPVIGNHADRRGRRRALVALGFTIGGVGFLAMAAAPTFWFIVVVSLLCGLGGATYHPQATAFIVQEYPNDRGRMLGIHGWGGSVGHFLAPAVVTLAVAAIDWRLSMVCIAIPLFLTSGGLQTALDETSPNPEATLRGAITRQLVIVAFAFGVLAAVMRAFLTFVVKMLVDEGWSETSAGTVLTIILMVGVIAQPLGGRVFDRIGGRIVFVSATVGVIASVALFAVSGGAVSLVAVSGVSFFGFALFPVSLALASQLASDGQTGAAVGVIFGITGLTSAAAQPLVGALGETLGSMRSALAWTVVAAVAVLPVALAIDRDTRKPDIVPARSQR